MPDSPSRQMFCGGIAGERGLHVSSLDPDCSKFLPLGPVSSNRPNSSERTRSQQQTRIAEYSFFPIVELTSLLHRLPKTSVKSQLNFSASSVFRRVHNACVEGLRINMQANSALVKVSRIEDAMHRLLRVNGARICGIHLDGIGRFQPARTVLQVFLNDPVILNQQASNPNSHPAILLAMSVHGACLSNFP